MPHLLDGTTNCRASIRREAGSVDALLPPIRDELFPGRTQLAGASFECLPDAQAFSYRTPRGRLDFALGTEFPKQRNAFGLNALKNSANATVIRSHPQGVIECSGVNAGTLAERLQAGGVLKFQGWRTNTRRDDLFTRCGRSVVFVARLVMRF
ncbi:hypothetical protein [Paraburkholderia sp. GAS348]|uniref:hypothetical protein n=1 Tax=Paraburkholderia sp. GAS348 TaxID=3035132 RepID=UPI003D1E3B5C